jgi:hypothetical protein
MQDGDMLRDMPSPTPLNLTFDLEMTRSLR